MKRLAISITAALFISILIMIPCGKALAASASIKMDGKFDDWLGMPHLEDKQGDSSSNQDIQDLYFGTNDGKSNLYFMIQRYSPSSRWSTAYYYMYFDTNNNGTYTDSSDMQAEIEYMPYNSVHGYVIVYVYTASGSLVGYSFGNWGDGYKSYSQRCEF